MQKINEDIRNNRFAPVYLLCGEEAYLRQQYKKKLKDAITGPLDTMNSAVYEGKGINPREIIDLSETMPFLAERRVILIENSGFFKSACDVLADYMKEIPPTTHILFAEEEVDKRGRLYKAVKAAGSVTEFSRQDEKTLRRWVLGIISREGKKITEDALAHFLMKTGADMENIAKELEKLLCYTLEKDSIERDDIEAVCTTVLTSHIFDMINAIAEKRQKEALDKYYELLAQKEPPMRILFLIARQFNLLMQVKELSGAGYDSRTIAEKTGLHGFVAGKYVTQSRRFTPEALREAVNSCAEAEEAVKTGRMNDIMSVELLIIKYSAA